MPDSPPRSPSTRSRIPGTALRASGKDGPQRIASRGKSMTEESEARFFDALGASCNVTWSAEAAGFCKNTVYRRRRLDGAFAARWQAALEQGYARIEMALVRRAADALEGFAPDPDTPIPEMTVGDAVTILKLHHAAVHGGGVSPRWRPRPRSLDEVRDSILAKLEAIEAARRAGVDPEALSDPDAGSAPDAEDASAA